MPVSGPCAPLLKGRERRSQDYHTLALLTTRPLLTLRLKRPPNRHRHHRPYVPVRRILLCMVAIGSN
jgi:hypothetical protein